MNLTNHHEIVKDKEAWRAAVHGVMKSQTRLNARTAVCTQTLFPAAIWWKPQRSLAQASALLAGGPGSPSVAGTHVVIKRQAFLLNSLAGRWQRLGSLPWGLCRLSRFGHPEHFSLLLSLNFHGSQALNIILSQRSFKTTICSFFALSPFFFPFFLFLWCGRGEEAGGRCFNVRRIALKL